MRRAWPSQLEFSVGLSGNHPVSRTRAAVDRRCAYRLGAQDACPSQYSASVDLRCSGCGSHPLAHDGNEWVCPGCAARYTGSRQVIEYPVNGSPTAEHYSLQWGDKFGFLEFVQTTGAPTAASELGWASLYNLIRETGGSVYDAGCGFGGITHELGNADGVDYFGADMHDQLDRIPSLLPGFRGILARWDITEPAPVTEQFDYVICRSTIHHTANPVATFRTLAAQIGPGGTFAFSAYCRKALLREVMDNGLQQIMRQLDPDKALAASRELAVLGRALQATNASISIGEPLEFLGIPSGDYPLHELVYYRLLKCFWNDLYGEHRSAMVNFDWYHPEHAYRFDLADLIEWVDSAGLTVTDAQSSGSQHYVEATRHR
jgi:SAM-dependent methyltransferase